MIRLTIGRAVIVCVLLVGMGYWQGYSHAAAAPADRPILRAIARLAKLGLWVMWCAEPAPPSAPETHVAHANAGTDGHVILRHGSGW